MRLTRLLVFAFFLPSLGAQTLSVPEGYFPRWVSVDQSNIATSHKPAPRQIPRSNTFDPQGYQWAIVNNTQAESQGWNLNSKITTAPATIDGVTYTEVVPLPNWFNEIKRRRMEDLYLRAYELETVRQNIVKDRNSGTSPLPSAQLNRLEALAKDRRDRLWSRATEIRQQLSQ